VTGPVNLTEPKGVESIHVISAQEMHRAVMEHASEADVVIKAAAVADFRPIERGEQKTKKGDAETMTIALQRNPDILAELGKQKGARVLVGFAAETEELLRHAGDKLQKKNLDMIVANDVSQDGAGFDGETNIVRLLTSDGEMEQLPLMTKDEVAASLLDRIVKLLPESRTGSGG
jgi:phosphopantothenoylcysteine decarboxylase/phosphopantothenate--cysteine ligase